MWRWLRLIEFSLNDFLWIQRIQWIMTKSKSGIVTGGITHLTTNTLTVPVIQSVFSLLLLGRYLLPLTTLNKYQPTDSNEKFCFTTTSRNVSIVRYRMSLVAILPLDYVMIHWIQRKSFRENSIKFLSLEVDSCYLDFLCRSEVELRHTLCPTNARNRKQWTRNEHAQHRHLSVLQGTSWSNLPIESAKEWCKNRQCESKIEVFINCSGSTSSAFSKIGLVLWAWTATLWNVNAQ